MRLVPLALLLVAAPALGQPAQLSADALARIKGTTCYIKVKVAGGMTSGSGFLVRKDDKTGWVATNNHVIAPTTGKKGDGEPMQVLGIEVVFHSGTAQEWRAAGVVVARDPLRDLAAVRFTVPKGAKLPEPVALPGVKASETMPVYVCGFPFGDMLAEGAKNPEISIGPASVSSVRTDDRGDVHRVQINGALNPGNSGGPIVDSAGKLVGVAVTTIVGAGLGQAVPQHHVKEMMDGRVSEPQLVRAGNGAISLAYVVDPVGRLKIGKGWVAPVSENKQTVPGVSGLKGAKDYAFARHPSAPDRYFAELPVGPGVAEVWTQSTWTDADGGAFKSKPRRVPVKTLGAAGIRPGGGPPPGNDDPPTDLPPDFFGGIPGLPNVPPPAAPGGPFAGRPGGPFGPRGPGGPFGRRAPKGDDAPGGAAPFGAPPQGGGAFPPTAPRGQALEADTEARSNELLDKLTAGPGQWLGRKFSLWLTVSGVAGNRLTASRPDGRPLDGLRVELNPGLAETVRSEHVRLGGGSQKGMVSFRVTRAEGATAVAEGLGVVLDPGLTGGGPAAAGADAGKPPIEEEEAPVTPKPAAPLPPAQPPAEMSAPPDAPPVAPADDEEGASGNVLIVAGVLMGVAVLAVGGVVAAVLYAGQKPKKKGKRRPRDWDDEDEEEDDRPRRRRRD